jgi:alpha-D-xyloside xylohydrolase
MYGKWAYGYWQSKEHYATRDELLGIAAEYRKRRIPIDNIVQDWNYWGNNDNWGGMIFDETKYPRPKEMIDRTAPGELPSHDFHLGRAGALFADLQGHGQARVSVSDRGLGRVQVLRRVQSHGHGFVLEVRERGIFSKGVDAWWMDSTEPDIVNALTRSRRV